MTLGSRFSMQPDMVGDCLRRWSFTFYRLGRPAIYRDGFVRETPCSLSSPGGLGRRGDRRTLPHLHLHRLRLCFNTRLASAPVGDMTRALAALPDGISNPRGAWIRVPYCSRTCLLHVLRDRLFHSRRRLLSGVAGVIGSTMRGARICESSFRNVFVAGLCVLCWCRCLVLCLWATAFNCGLRRYVRRLPRIASSGTRNIPSACSFRPLHWSGIRFGLTRYFRLTGQFGPTGHFRLMYRFGLTGWLRRAACRAECTIVLTGVCPREAGNILLPGTIISVLARGLWPFSRGGRLRY